MNPNQETTAWQEAIDALLKSVYGRLPADSSDSVTVECIHLRRLFALRHAPQSAPAAVPAGVEELDETAFKIAQSLWGYFHGGSAGSHDAMLWFANNRTLGGPAHVIERVKSHLIPKATPPIPDKKEVREAIEQAVVNQPHQFVAEALEANPVHRAIVARVLTAITPYLSALPPELHGGDGALRTSQSDGGEDKQRLMALAGLIWETRWAGEQEDYQQMVGIAAEIRSGNFDGIDAARAQAKGEAKK